MIKYGPSYASHLVMTMLMHYEECFRDVIKRHAADPFSEWQDFNLATIMPANPPRQDDSPENVLQSKQPSLIFTPPARHEVSVLAGRGGYIVDYTFDIYYLYASPTMIGATTDAPNVACQLAVEAIRQCCSGDNKPFGIGVKLPAADPIPLAPIGDPVPLMSRYVQFPLTLQYKEVYPK